MKKLLSFLLLLLTLQVYSQNVLGQYEVNFNGWYRGANNHHCGDAFVEINFANSAHNYRALHITYWENSPDAYVTNHKTRFAADRTPVNMYFSSSRRVRSSCSGDRPHNNGYISSTNKFNCLNFNFKFDQFYDGNDDDGVGLWNSDFNVKVYPLLTIINPNGSLPVDDKITLRSHFGFALNEYNWQYSLNASTWTNLPQYNGMNNILIDAKDILGPTAENYHGQHIYFRQIVCGTVTSNTADYIIRRSAPHIVQTILTPTTCSDTNDGKAKVFFDRPLLPNELLGYTLEYNSTSISMPADGSLTFDNANSFEIANLGAYTYTLKLLGGLNGVPTYTEGINHQSIFTITKPTPVNFALSKTNVWCNGGNDGSVTINATGGNILDGNSGPIRYFYCVNNGPWLPFSSETSHTISTLLPGSYTIKVKDYRDCIAKTPQGAEKQLTEVLTQPLSPVSLIYTEVLQPTFNGGTNGRLVAAITGGTRNLGNSYNYEWKNSAGVLQTNVVPFYDAGSTTYYLTLNGISSDTYTLTIKDRNFSSATHQVGCAVLNSQQFLGQPDPLAVAFSVQKTISCHVLNTFGDETDFNPTDGQRDESQDGILVANVTGGVPFSGFENNGLPYKYFWKKQLPNGSWVAWNDQNATAENLSHGNYALNVEDKNGIKLGTYVNNEISQEIDVTYFMAQPAKLELSFQKGSITCGSGNDGWAKAIPVGGTPPYIYEWTTGGTSDTLTNLMANNYFVKITDAKGCSVQGSVLIDQPNGVQINDVLTSPSCFGGNDGSVQIQVVGGTAPFQYTWNTGATSQNLSNLMEGTYTVTVVDAQGCTYYKSHTLTNPTQITVDLGADRVLCNGQSQELDITIPDSGAQYQWTSTTNFSSSQPSVSLVNPGTYHAKITSSLGCVAEDDIVITTSQVNIASEFFLSTQAYLDEEVVLVNTSNPLGQNTTWIIPANVTVVTQNENYTVLKFNQLGAYTISLKQTQGDCYALYSKVINVEQRSIMPNLGNTSNPFISEFTITPNPNNGNFNAIIKIQESSPIKLRMYALNGQQSLLEQSGNGQTSYVIPFNTNFSAGIYALVLETAKQTLIKKIIIY